MNLELLSRKQVALVLGVHYVTIINWEKKGIIKSFCTVNGRPRYHIGDVAVALSTKRGGASCK
jgi:predicted site-specific integrase-resolvase